MHHYSVGIESEALRRAVAYRVAPFPHDHAQVERENAQLSFPVVEDQGFGEEGIDQDLRWAPASEDSGNLGAHLGRDINLGRTREQ